MFSGHPSLPTPSCRSKIGARSAPWLGAGAGPGPMGPSCPEPLACSSFPYPPLLRVLSFSKFFLTLSNPRRFQPFAPPPPHSPLLPLTSTLHLIPHLCPPPVLRVLYPLHTPPRRPLPISVLHTEHLRDQIPRPGDVELVLWGAGQEAIDINTELMVCRK